MVGSPRQRELCLHLKIIALRKWAMHLPSLSVSHCTSLSCICSSVRASSPVHALKNYWTVSDFSVAYIQWIDSLAPQTLQSKGSWVSGGHHFFFYHFQSCWDLQRALLEPCRNFWVSQRFLHTTGRRFALHECFQRNRSSSTWCWFGACAVTAKSRVKGHPRGGIWGCLQLLSKLVALPC